MIACYNSGRVILRQGHMVNNSSCVYYIIHGHLNVEIETTNPITLLRTSELVKKLGPGEFFGEVAILFNDVRMSTVTSISDVELLYITKENFDEILKDSLEKEWSKVRNALHELPYFFGDWPDIELRRCSIISTLIHFKEGDLILGD
ncbi:cAMP-dependent protein kinase regulatory subunit-like [Lycorma delicatula]|uniref:cAMP-dependent protein kinase regulatory subunit-like n=1 Tax=Lycorma delicatula TaxID=130591 RepID=UPI003F513947